MLANSVSGLKVLTPGVFRWGLQFRELSLHAIRQRTLSKNLMTSSLYRNHKYFGGSVTATQFSSTNISPSSNIGESNKKKEEEVKATGVNRLKILWKRYGLLSVVTYFSLYGCTLVGMFFAVEANIFDAATFGFEASKLITSFCDNFEYFTGNKGLPAFLRQNPHYGKAVIAYVLTKFTEPVRIGITVLAVPKIASILKQRRVDEEK